MHGDSNIIVDTPLQGPSTTFPDDMATWLPTAKPLVDSPAVTFDQEFTTREYEVPSSRAATFPRLLRSKALYASRSVETRTLYDAGKRCLDVVGALTLLLLTSPVFLIVAILVKLTSPGPVFFRHKRLGRNGNEFSCLKFRTMVANAEDRLKNSAALRKQFEESFKIHDDPRITTVGAFLRRTSIDELPQLFQVLCGQMSLIGPRPIVRPELSKYSIYANKLLTVKPGLSGLWQVSGRSDTTYVERVQLDIRYIDHRCLSLDLQLLLLTVIVVLRKSGAY